MLGLTHIISHPIVGGGAWLIGMDNGGRLWRGELGQTAMNWTIKWIEVEELPSQPITQYP